MEYARGISFERNGGVSSVVEELLQDVLVYAMS